MVVATQEAGLHFDARGTGALSQRIWTLSPGSAFPTTVTLVERIVPPMRVVPGLPDSGSMDCIETKFAFASGTAAMRVAAIKSKAESELFSFNCCTPLIFRGAIRRVLLLGGTCYVC